MHRAIGQSGETQGEYPGQARGLGASDMVSAMFAAFYLTFPRQPVPFLWVKSNVVCKEATGTLTKVLGICNQGHAQSRKSSTVGSKRCIGLQPRPKM